jgi:hypothetical protein
MADYQIPITYVVSASAITPQAGLEPLKLSTVLILTDENPVQAMTDSYMITRTATAAVNAYGTNSETAAQVNAVYSQQPNILANNGYVIIAPYNSTTQAATPGQLSTIDLSSNLASLQTVTNGDLTIVVNGVSQELTALDFSGAENLDDIAQVIQNDLTGATVTASDNELLFVSTETGSGSSIELAATSGANTDLYGSAYLDGANATASAGEDAFTVYETFSEAIERLAGEIYFEGILTTRNVPSAEMITASNAVEALQNRILMAPISEVSDLANLAVSLSGNPHTRPVMYLTGDTAEERARNARIFAAAYLSRGLAVNYSGSNTTLTMNLKTLNGIVADTQISETILESAKDAGVDCYPSIEGLAKVASFKHANQYFDQVTNLIWFVNTIQREVFNVLATTGTKVPQTEPGLEIIRGAIRGVCNQAVTNGYVAPGVWNSPDTFGDYDDFHRNIEEFGFYEYHQPVAEQSQSERELRQAPVWQIAAKESGAVHSANILIYVEA